MHTLTLVYERNGEFAHTAAPVAVWSGQYDLSEEKAYLFLADDWGRTRSKKRYFLAPVTLPAWMSGDEYLAGHVTWDFCWAMAARKGDADWLKGQPRTMQSNFRRLPAPAGRYVAARLWQSELRTPFRTSLKAQLLAWLSDEHPLPSPLSPRQRNA
jgi:hypothetical protein